LLKSPFGKLIRQVERSGPEDILGNICVAVSPAPKHGSIILFLKDLARWSRSVNMRSVGYGSRERSTRLILAESQNDDWQDEVLGSICSRKSSLSLERLESLSSFNA